MRHASVEKTENGAQRCGGVKPEAANYIFHILTSKDAKTVAFSTCYLSGGMCGANEANRAQIIRNIFAVLHAFVYSRREVVASDSPSGICW